MISLADKKMLRLVMISSTVAMKEIYFFIPLPHRLINSCSICPEIHTLSLSLKNIHLFNLFGCTRSWLQHAGSQSSACELLVSACGI